MNNSQAPYARNVFACNSSVSISISIQGFLFQNLSNSFFFNPSKLLVSITAQKPQSWNTCCVTSLLQLVCKPVISWVHLSCSSWTRRVTSFSLFSFSIQVLTLQISSMFFLPSPFPTPTSRSSVLVQGLFQTSCLSWFSLDSIPPASQNSGICKCKAEWEVSANPASSNWSAGSSLKVINNVHFS